MNYLGLIVNPIAGVGGEAGFKGSDDPEIVREALNRGARPIAPARAKLFLKEIRRSDLNVRVCAGAGRMGEDEAVECGFKPEKVVGGRRKWTSPSDTIEAAETMLLEGVDLMVFCGGDGTARDVASAIDLKMPVLGVPAGVKVYSAVFSINPIVAALIARDFLEGRTGVNLREVLDIDENMFRRGLLSVKLYGYLKVPIGGLMLQSSKTFIPLVDGGEEEMKSIGKYVLERMNGEATYIIGPGSTTKAICDLMGLKKTLLGVDVIRGGRMVAQDADALKILKEVGKGEAVIIVSPLGGQGYIFGRGNQQINSEVIRRVGRDNIIVIATRSKLRSIEGRRLLVDTGDLDLDEELRGYIRVIVGYREEVVMRVE